MRRPGGDPRLRKLVGVDTGIAATVLLELGAVLVSWSAALHLQLWSTGYREIATIGPLFLAQGIGAALVAIALAVFRRIWLACVAMVVAAGTICGFLVSVTVGLFGFQDTWRAPYAGLAFVVECAALVVLGLSVIASGRALRHRADASRRPGEPGLSP